MWKNTVFIPSMGIYGACMLLGSCANGFALRGDAAVSSVELEIQRAEVMRDIVTQGHDDQPEPMIEVPSGPLVLNLSDAVAMAVEQNPGLRVSALAPLIEQVQEDVARAAFDPVLNAEASYQREQSDNDAAVGAGLVGMQQLLPAGTRLELAADYADSHGDVADIRSAGYRLKVTQPLLQGMGRSVNLAELRLAEMQTGISRFEFRATVERFVAQVEAAYWDVLVARSAIAIFERSLLIAEEQAEEIQERIRLGDVGASELAAAVAETASRRQNLIAARSAADKAKLQLLRLLSPAGASPWERELTLSEPARVVIQALGAIDVHVAAGFAGRSDLKQALLEVDKGDVEIMRTRNGLLPRLDVFAQLGGSLYARSFADAPDEDDDVFIGRVGATYEYSLGARAERARYRSAQVSQEQTFHALENMKNLIQQEIRGAYVEVTHMAEQITASTATRKLREQVLEIEQEKFRLGTSTALSVAQASRDFIASQISEIEAQVAYRKALLDLYLSDGTLLERRGVQVQ
ncbi:MAG: TolC family protein [Planctomycetota bacterium]|jgi:outer membrane protein|nr:TolC family protein [Planctomycetota bacterium]